MKASFQKILKGYGYFRKKYTLGDNPMMQSLSEEGQKPEVMVVACCDSRVDPALLLQCDPGDLFVVRNVANIVPPCEKDERHHGTSAALEFAVCFLKVKHLIILGHSQCGGIQTLLNNDTTTENDFISNWVSLIKTEARSCGQDDFAKRALLDSYQNCLTFPWIKERVDQEELMIHLWFFDIKSGKIFAYVKDQDTYIPLLPIDED